MGVDAPINGGWLTVDAVVHTAHGGTEVWQGSLLLQHRCR